jgi:hypothetical protein
LPIGLGFQDKNNQPAIRGLKAANLSPYFSGYYFGEVGGKGTRRFSRNFTNISFRRLTGTGFSARIKARAVVITFKGLRGITSLSYRYNITAYNPIGVSYNNSSRGPLTVPGGKGAPARAAKGYHYSKRTRAFITRLVILAFLNKVKILFKIRLKPLFA